MPDAKATPWIRRFHPATPGGARLVCFPHAGGSAGFYFPFSEAWRPQVEVLAIQYPGRQDRYGEPCVPTITALADAVSAELLATEADRPLALFGHSMGAVVAYEVARRLQAAGVRPAALFASGRRAPSCLPSDDGRARSDAQLVADLQRLDGTDAAVLQDEEMLQLILPAIRNDYRAVEAYRHRPGVEVACPVTVLVGDADPTTTIEQAGAWRRHTAGRFEQRVFAGGHFYLTAHRAAVVALVSDCLAPVRGPAPRAP